MLRSFDSILLWILCPIISATDALYRTSSLLQVVELLVESKADVSTLNRDGANALMGAALANQVEV